MTTLEVANRLVELCNQGQWQQAQSELYSKDCVSIEAPAGKEEQIVKGMDAITEKGKEWASSVEEMHEMYIKDLIVTANHFTFRQGIDATYKGAGRLKMEEISLYTVQDGKIIQEQFFY